MLGPAVWCNVHGSNVLVWGLMPCVMVPWHSARPLEALDIVSWIKCNVMMPQVMGLGSYVYIMGPMLGKEVIVSSTRVKCVYLGSNDKFSGSMAFCCGPRTQ